ncbi:MAG: hypothetical protein K5897_06590 [Eubacterium sp.]|nr:hypothetical protein [Eubacterium sp.]
MAEQENVKKKVNNAKKTAHKKPAKKKKINKKKLALILSILGVFVLAGIGYAVFAFTGRGSITIGGAIRGYFKSIEAEDVDKYIRTCYPSAWSDHYVPRGYDVDITLLTEAVFARQTGISVKEVNVQREEKLEEVFVKRFHDKIQEIYDVDLGISEVYRVYFSLKVSYIDNGEEVTYDSDTRARYIYKYKGKWYYMADTLLLVDMDLEDQ